MWSIWILKLDPTHTWVSSALPFLKSFWPYVKNWYMSWIIIRPQNSITHWYMCHPNYVPSYGFLLHVFLVVSDTSQSGSAVKTCGITYLKNNLCLISKYWNMLGPERWTVHIRYRLYDEKALRRQSKEQQAVHCLFPDAGCCPRRASPHAQGRVSLASAPPSDHQQCPPVSQAATMYNTST